MVFALVFDLRALCFGSPPVYLNFPSLLKRRVNRGNAGMPVHHRSVFALYQVYQDRTYIFKWIHRKKKVREFPVPSRDVTTKRSLGGNNDVITELFLPRGSMVSDIPAGEGKLVNLFLRCRNVVSYYLTKRKKLNWNNMK